MPNGERILLVAFNFFLQIEIHVATLDTDQCITDNTHTISRCFNPDASSFCSPVSLTVRHRQSMYQAKRSGCRSV